ncbi:hypothetical protein ACLRGI_13260 [Paenarthrobacter nitroguajacolicus]|uniref:hypothetical protein n=1 Tax=Paenarthrobacter nitroguajacolicus TaxID=211146 RepID=UPI003AE7DC51
MNAVSYHRYAVAAPRIHVDIIEDHTVLLECLAAWLATKAPDIVVVGRYGCWAEAVVDLDDLSDVVVLDILLGDSVPLVNKIRTLRSAGVNVVVLSSEAPSRFTAVQNPAELHCGCRSGGTVPQEAGFRLTPAQGGGGDMHDGGGSPSCICSVECGLSDQRRSFPYIGTRACFVGE